jgi:hypothetical protein
MRDRSLRIVETDFASFPDRLGRWANSIARGILPIRHKALIPWFPMTVQGALREIAF